MCVQHGFHAILMTTRNKCMWSMLANTWLLYSKTLIYQPQSPMMSLRLDIMTQNQNSKCLKTEWPAPVKKFCTMPLSWKAMLTLGFKLYSSAMPMSEGNCEWWVQYTKHCFVACTSEKKRSTELWTRQWFLLEDSPQVAMPALTEISLQDFCLYSVRKQHTACVWEVECWKICVSCDRHYFKKRGGGGGYAKAQDA